MLLEYEKVTDDIINALKKEEYENVSLLLDKREDILKGLESSGDLESFKLLYKGSKVYKKDLDIEFMLCELKNMVLKEISNFTKLKEGNMTYINTLKDDMPLFIAKV